MPQVSRNKPDPLVRKKIKQLLIDCISQCNNVDTASKFLNDFLTRTEKTVLGKRLATALMLLKNDSAEEIANTLKVSKSTIYKSKTFLEISSDGYREVLQKIIDHDKKMVKKHKQAQKDYENSPLFQRTSGWKGLKASQRQKIKDTEVPF